MAVIIVRRDGLDGQKAVAEWDPEEGFVSGSMPFTDDPAYEDYDEEQMYAEFDGPDLFAVPSDEFSKSYRLSDFGRGLHKDSNRCYIDRVAEAPDDKIVHVEEEGDEKRLYYEE